MKGWIAGWAAWENSLRFGYFCNFISREKNYFFWGWAMAHLGPNHAPPLTGAIRIILFKPHY